MTKNQNITKTINSSDKYNMSLKFSKFYIHFMEFCSPCCEYLVLDGFSAVKGVPNKNQIWN